MYTKLYKVFAKYLGPLAKNNYSIRDTLYEIIRNNGKITTQVYDKMKKLPVHWTSKIPMR